MAWTSPNPFFWVREWNPLIASVLIQYNPPKLIIIVLRGSLLRRKVRGTHRGQVSAALGDPVPPHGFFLALVFHISL
jgi:hypothetical protein